MRKVPKRFEVWHLTKARAAGIGTQAVGLRCVCGGMVDYWYDVEGRRRVLRHWHQDGLELDQYLEQTEAMVREAVSEEKRVVRYWLDRIHTGELTPR